MLSCTRAPAHGGLRVASAAALLRAGRAARAGRRTSAPGAAACRARPWSCRDRRASSSSQTRERLQIGGAERAPGEAGAQAATGAARRVLQPGERAVETAGGRQHAGRDRAGLARQPLEPGPERHQRLEPRASAARTPDRAAAGRRARPRRPRAWPRRPPAERAEQRAAAGQLAVDLGPGHARRAAPAPTSDSPRQPCSAISANAVASRSGGSLSSWPWRASSAQASSRERRVPAAIARSNSGWMPSARHQHLERRLGGAARAGDVLAQDLDRLGAVRRRARRCRRPWRARAARPASAGRPLAMPALARVSISRNT